MHTIHIWTPEEIMNLKEVKFNKNTLLPLNEIKEKVKSGEKLALSSLFEAEENGGLSVFFYGLVQTKEGVILSNIVPGVGYIETDLEVDLNDSECNMSSLILFDLLTINPKWYNIREEISKDPDADKEVRLLKASKLLDPVKHFYGDA